MTAPVAASYSFAFFLQQINSSAGMSKRYSSLLLCAQTKHSKPTLHIEHHGSSNAHFRRPLLLASLLTTLAIGHFFIVRLRGLDSLCEVR